MNGYIGGWYHGTIWMEWHDEKASTRAGRSPRNERQHKSRRREQRISQRCQRRIEEKRESRGAAKPHDLCRENFQNEASAMARPRVPILHHPHCVWMSYTKIAHGKGVYLTKFLRLVPYRA